MMPYEECLKKCYCGLGTTDEFSRNASRNKIADSQQLSTIAKTTKFAPEVAVA